MNARNDSRWTALKIAVLHRQKEIIEVLLGAGADTKVKDEVDSSLLIDAAMLGDIDHVNLLPQTGTQRDTFSTFPVISNEGPDC